MTSSDKEQNMNKAGFATVNQSTSEEIEAFSYFTPAQTEECVARADKTFQSFRKLSVHKRAQLFSNRNCRRAGVAEGGRCFVIRGRSTRRGAETHLGHACRAHGRPVQSEGRRYSLEIETERVHRCQQ